MEKYQILHVIFQAREPAGHRGGDEVSVRPAERVGAEPANPEPLRAEPQTHHRGGGGGPGATPNRLHRSLPGKIVSRLTTVQRRL